MYQATAGPQGLEFSATKSRYMHIDNLNLHPALTQHETTYINQHFLTLFKYQNRNLPFS